MKNSKHFINYINEKFETKFDIIIDRIIKFDIKKVENCLMNNIFNEKELLVILITIIANFTYTYSDHNLVSKKNI